MEHTRISPPESRSAPIALLGTLPPLQAVARILSHFSRQQVEGFVEIAVAMLDVLDGDTDIEANGDELDGSASEDDFMEHPANWKGEPGCPISDPDSAVDDRPCDGETDSEPEEGAAFPKYGLDQTKGPLPPVSPGQDQALIRPYLDCIRRTRCEKVVHQNPNTRRDQVEYRLKETGG